MLKNEILVERTLFSYKSIYQDWISSIPYMNYHVPSRSQQATVKSYLWNWYINFFVQISDNLTVFDICFVHHLKHFPIVPNGNGGENDRISVYIRSTFSSSKHLCKGTEYSNRLYKFENARSDESSFHKIKMQCFIHHPCTIRFVHHSVCSKTRKPTISQLFDMCSKCLVYLRDMGIRLWKYVVRFTLFSLYLLPSTGLSNVYASQFLQKTFTEYICVKTCVLNLIKSAIKFTAIGPIYKMSPFGQVMVGTKRILFYLYQWWVNLMAKLRVNGLQLPTELHRNCTWRHGPSNANGHSSTTHYITPAATC